MKLLEINPLRIWSYYPIEGIDRTFLSRIRTKGWEGIPPIPVFEIPKSEEIKLKIPGSEDMEFKIYHEYLLMDGSHRREAANQLWLNVPAAVYEYGEEVLVKEHGLAPFAHSTNPEIYRRLTKGYIIRDKLDISRILE